jgi:hypothetical protein
MIIDFNNSSVNVDFHCDVCIVGGGPAGISLALELNEQGLSTCLIESGGLKISRKNQRLNRVNNLGIPYKDLSVQRGRFLGGSSNLWGGNCIPLDPIDFRAIKARDFNSWPFSYSSLEPYIVKAQMLLGIDSSRFGDGLLQKIKLAPNQTEDGLFDFKAWQFCDFPFRFGDKFYDQLSSFKRITVVLNANIVDFEFFPGEVEASSVVIKNLTGKKRRMKAANFVLACGGVENARILLNVADSSCSSVLSDLDAIGRNFSEHPNATIGYLEGENARKIYEAHKIKYIDGSKEIKPGLGISSKVQEEKGVLNGIVSIWPVSIENNTVTRAKLLFELFRKKEFGLKFLLNTFLVLPGIVSLLPHVRHRIRGGITSSPQRTDRFEVRLMTETVSNPFSRVELTSQKDSIGLRLASLDWRLTERDKASFLSIAKLAKVHFEKEQGVELLLERWVTDESMDWTRFINHDGHYGHHMGTTKMGVNHNDSVVDQNCKVHGLKNIYIAGSSVFPTFGFANPTLTIVALSIKLAGHLRQKLNV